MDTLTREVILRQLLTLTITWVLSSREKNK